MRLIQLANNAASKLSANVSNSGTSISVTPGEGSKFPTLTGSQYFMATMVRSDGSTEIVKVTARSTDTMTIARAAEPVGGAATAFSFSAGDKFEARLTAGELAGELDRLDSLAIISPINKSANYTVTEADVTSLIRCNSGAGGITITLPAISTLIQDFDIIISKVTSDANVVAVNRSSTDTINGSATYNLTTQWQSVWLIADRSTNTWTAINSGSGVVNAVVDPFTGAGSAGPFTLSADPGSVYNLAVFVGGVYQQKSTLTLVGTSLTLGGAVTTGVPIEACYTTALPIGTPSDGTVTAAKMAAGAAVGNIGYTPVNKSGDTLSGALNNAPQVTIASASTVAIGAAAANSVIVTGTTTITAFDTIAAGALRIVKFSGTLTLTHNATTLILPGAANIATGANDVAIFESQGSGKWQCVSYTKANGGPVALIGSTLSDGTNTGSITDAIKGSAKAWVEFNGTTAGIRSSYNVSSVTRDATGNYTVTMTNAMTDTNYGALATAGNLIGDGTGNAIFCLANAITSSTVNVHTRNAANSDNDYSSVTLAIFR